MSGETSLQLKALLETCAGGDRESRVKFQGLFGESIYNYPMKTFHLPSDRAADFYIYVFENDRIFRRVRGFEARNDGQFKTYLHFYVLRDLFLEWQRSQKELETVSLATVVFDGPGGTGVTLEDLLPAASSDLEDSLENRVNALQSRDFLEKLDLDKRLLLKLLHLAEFDLSPQEIRLLCKKSGRSYRDVIFDLEEVRSRLQEKDEQSNDMEAQLESIHGWILVYQKELKKVADRIASLPEGSAERGGWVQKRDDLERKLEWRHRQKSRALEKMRQFRITTPYKDIARLLNAPLGTVCSLVARTREDISEIFVEADTLKQAAIT